jgi:hypothetical protein
MAKDNVPTSIESTEALRAWAEEIEREIAEITASILPLQQRLDASHEKLDLVHRLIHLSAPAQTSAPSKVEAPPFPRMASLPGVEDRIEEILRNTGKPMHIRDIRDSLIQMGVPLPGKGDEANIILRLRRDSDRFVRTARGTYALVAWNLPEYLPAPRKKKVQRGRGATP